MGDTMIRESIKHEIYEKLNYDIFRFEDFVVKEKLNDQEYFIDIRKNEFYFMIKFDFNDSSNVRILYLPGMIFNEDTELIPLSNFNSSVKRSIASWLTRVKIEMLNPMQCRYIDNTIEAFIDDINSKLDNIDDTYFTKSEGEDLAIRLEKLEILLTERESKDENKELLQEITRMKNEISFLKNTIDKMTKRKWLKNTLLKMRAWSKNPQNKELIMMGMEGVKAISQLDFPNIKN
jgi:hypothetical protein